MDTIGFDCIVDSEVMVSVDFEGTEYFFDSKYSGDFLDFVSFEYFLFLVY